MRNLLTIGFLLFVSTANAASIATSASSASECDKVQKRAYLEKVRSCQQCFERGRGQFYLFSSSDPSQKPGCYAGMNANSRWLGDGSRTVKAVKRNRLERSE